MKLLPLVITALPLVAAQCCATTVNANAPVQTPAARQAPAPTPVNDVLVVQPFTLQQGYRSTWSKEPAIVSSGVIVVLAVDPALATRRNAAERVLYAGNTPVERLNDGGQSGRVIGIVPGTADLAAAPIWFGAPGLPERATPDTVRAQRALADKAGIRPFQADKLRSTTRPAVTATDQAALLRDHVAPLLLEYSPQEKELADAWRRPVVTAPQKP